MNKKILQSFFISLLVVLNSNAQTTEKDRQSYDKANAIIELSQKAIYQSVQRKNIKSLYLQTGMTAAVESVIQMEGIPTPRETRSRLTAESNISIELPGKIHQKILSYDEAKNPIENYSKIESLIDGEKFSQTIDTIINGKALDINAMLNTPSMPENLKKQMRESMEKAKPTKEKIQTDISEQLFTILLSSEWGNDKVFIYIGKAEANDGRADILEIESKTGRQTRYFFDEKTHLLLMITDEASKSGMSVKTTKYFSDYKLVDGLMIAKKINVETETSGNLTMNISGQITKLSSKTKTITETLVKEFKINPVFKPETFAIKETK